MLLRNWSATVMCLLFSGTSVSLCFSAARNCKQIQQNLLEGSFTENFRSALFSTMKTNPSKETKSVATSSRLLLPPEKLLVHWRGEDVEGYSLSFRHPEFIGALTATTNFGGNVPPICFQNALKYDGEAYMSEVKLRGFNEAMQWLTFSDAGDFDRRDFSREAFILAASRCSLINTVYEVISDGTQYSELNEKAIANGGFDDMMVGAGNEKATWAVRVRHFGDEAGTKKERRHSQRTRSIKLEKEALLALKPLLLKFGGSVDLTEPDCKIYIMDGLTGKKVLVRQIAYGPKIFSIAPPSRICVTTTPLEPIAAYSLCNIAGIRQNQRILDPYSGSCAILLAASMILPSCQTVGVDIAHDGLINRDHIREDFATRGLAQPKAVFRGDSTDASVRDKARAAVGNVAFDHIITDPPYGIREKMDANAPTPLEEMFQAIEEDRNRGFPLLKRGGRLVCFVPCHEGTNIADVLPSNKKAEAAGMKFLLSREQPLNSKLSRWLVAYECIR